MVCVEYGNVYATRDGKPLLFDLYRPAEPGERRPLVVLVHGGFWFFGWREEISGFAYDLAAHDYVAASIDYRLADGETMFPEPVADVLAAIRYFRDHAGALGVDPERFALLGKSAGGHLALLAGMAEDASLFDSDHPQGQSAGIRAIVNLFGPTDLTIDPSTVADWQVGVVEHFLGVPVEHESSLARQASPVTYARSDGPAILTIHGEADCIVPVTQGRALAAALDAAGQLNVYVEVPGMDHFFGGIWFSGWAQEYRETILDFLAPAL
jgi:acetyl esterase/lipase